MRSIIAKAHCQVSLLAQLSNDYQIVILSCYVKLFCKIAVVIFFCYDKSCYRLFFKYQLSRLFALPFFHYLFCFSIIPLAFYRKCNFLYDWLDSYSLSILL